jgi:aminotransferase
MDNPAGLFENLSREYLERRELFYPVLVETGFKPIAKPAGAYYVMCDISSFGFKTDTEFAHWLVEKGGVATVPGSSFYDDPRDGHGKVRFAFCKKLDTLRAAAEKLRALPKPPGRKAT